MVVERITERENKRQQLLQQIYARQYELSSALGITYNPQEYLYRSYDVVTDWVRLKAVKEHGEPNTQQLLLQEIENNIRTNLMERYQVTESSRRYVIKDNQMYAHAEALSPVIEMWKNGVEYRKNLGSLELEREQAELDGFAFIEEVMTDSETPIGVSIISFSPPGEIPLTAYPGKFVDIFTLSEDAVGRYVTSTRKVVDYDMTAYQHKALSVDSSYFDGYLNGSIDAWFLRNPIVTQHDASELFDLANGMDWSTFSRIYSETPFAGLPLRRFIDHYLEVIQRDPPEWRSIALAFNAIINRADDLKKEFVKSLESSVVYRHYGREISVDEAAYFNEQLRQLGRRHVEVVAMGGCPPSRGYETGLFGNTFAQEFYQMNSVTQFIGQTADYKQDSNLCRCGGNEPHFHCPGNNGACQNVIVVGKGINRCPKCGQGKIC